ncbi:hypothetical protein BDP27DRAFT_1323131 [Rhodocollybia butyracea]|uniref:O-fucosyltransferase family protein n=1 Tax=Rhodocollybia butyracea TaxID=206335 RepID=A0A9P5UAA8_9AGAR|nr:hypothetical protein BDP27DRAFT_1323131 [Rhodocollybia butyracea]
MHHLIVLVVYNPLLQIATICISPFLFYFLCSLLWLVLDPPTISTSLVIEVDPLIAPCLRMSSPHEKYLSYLPHSGFHNQRIALENALTLSRILNRTLLIPPIRLGRPLRYVNYNSLYSFVALSGKNNLTHCSKTALDVPLPSECLDYFGYTFLPWEWLFDFFAIIHDNQQAIFRWNLTDAWISECLNISSSDVRVLKDSSRYHFRFSDDPSNKRKSKFSEDLQISTLTSFPETLLQFGTLFGSSRLYLSEPTHYHIRSQIRENMIITNPYLLRVADLVAKSLGDSYLGVHVRLGDGQFQVDDGARARSVWSSLVQDKLGLSTEEARVLEQNSIVLPDEPLDGSQEPLRDILGSRLQCRGGDHTQAHLLPLNTPLFIATDAKDPTTNPHLALFFNTFPCAFHLGDFAEHLTILNQLENHLDGVKLKSFLLPFLDAMIVGKAAVAVGTPGSTFSTYVTDVLWPKYYNLKIT